MRRLLTTLGLGMTLVASAWAQCGPMVWNPVSRQMDCTGLGGSTTGLVAGAASLIGSGSLLRDASAGTVGLSGVYDTGAGLIKIGTPTKPASLNVGSIVLQSLATPTAPVITMGGTTGATTYTYTVAALLVDGTTTTVASSAGSTTTGNATLDVTNYNIITWAAVTGATSYNVFRTVGGATQGKIISATTAVTGNDTGLAASGAAPTVNGTGSLLWATTGGGNIGVAGGNNSPLEIYALNGVAANYITGGIAVITGATGAFSWSGRGTLFSSGIGIFSLTGVTNSYAGIATGSINGFAIQSAAGTSTFNDAVSANSATVAERKIFTIESPTLTSTGTAVTYTLASALHLGLPVASTNVTIGTVYSLITEGPIKAAGYSSSDGTVGVTVTGCTGFKNGLCISGT